MCKTTSGEIQHGIGRHLERSAKDPRGWNDLTYQVEIVQEAYNSHAVSTFRMLERISTIAIS